jgi:ribose-phosphate pyrophosphokinase
MYRHVPLSIICGNASRDLAEKICAYLGLTLTSADVFEFSNENIFVKINETVREHDVFVVQSFSSPVNRHIMELFILLDTLKRASAGRITAVIPYFAYGRTDKKDQPRVPITARLLADLITTAGANRVLTMDLHAGQIEGFFSIPVDHLSAFSTLIQYFMEKHLDDVVVVAPDFGFAKKARNFAERLGAPLAFIEKRRPGNDMRSEVLSVIGDIRHRAAIIIDDEIDTAGSVTNAAWLLYECGVQEIYACCTHAVFSGPAVERLRTSPLHEIVVTDTIALPPEKRLPNLTVLSVAPLFAEAIQRIHSGESVGALFR